MNTNLSSAYGGLGPWPLLILNCAAAVWCAAGFLPLNAWAEPVPPAVPDVARPLPLSDVRLTGGPLNTRKIRRRIFAQTRTGSHVGLLS